MHGPTKRATASRLMILTAMTLLLAVALMAGCLAVTDSDSGPTQQAPADQDTAGSPGNNTSGENESARGQEAPALGNLTMDEATTSRPNETTVIHRWNHTLSPDTPNASTAFDLPNDAAFHLSADLAWPGTDTGLTLTVASPDTLYICETSSTQTPSSGQLSCEATSLAQEDADRWTVEVDRGIEDAGPPTTFSLTLTLRSLAPDTVPVTASLLPADSGSNETTHPGWPEPSDATVRPGVKIAGGRCTASFLFATPDNSTLYIASASHCFSGDALGDPVDIARWSFEGTLAYCSWGAQEALVTCPEKGFGEDEGYRQDLALVELPDHARQHVHPAVLVWGGPVKLGNAPSQGTQVLTYGNTDFRDGSVGSTNTLDSRPGLVVESQAETTIAAFPSPIVAGDSGGPVLTAEGASVGVLSFTESGVPATTSPAAGISNLAPAIDQLREKTGRSVELVTWPLFDPPRAEILENGAPGS